MRFWHIFTFIFVIAMASHAAQPSEVYWKLMLPKTPMPKVVQELLPSGNGGSNTVDGNGNKDDKTSVSVWHNGGGVSIGTGHPSGKPISVTTPPFLYKYASTKDQLQDNPNVALFFLEKDLHQGTSMNLHFVNSSNEAKFLPREVADSIPFSSKKIPEILNGYSLDSNSMQVKAMKQTIEECEASGIEGEEKYCCTSLESMVDFAISKLGKNIQAISTEVEKETPLQKYSFSGVKKMASEKAVVCHKQNYPYAVFYCHKTEAIKAYKVSMAASSDGSKVEAVAVCHTDTSAWNPRHLAFQVLKVEPGTVPICHFLPEDHIVWLAK